MGFCPRLCGLPMLHMTILSKGYFPGFAARSASISPAFATIAPRTAYCMSLTFWLMVSMVIPAIARVWVFSGAAAGVSDARPRSRKEAPRVPTLEETARAVRRRANSVLFARAGRRRGCVRAATTRRPKATEARKARPAAR